MKYCLIILPGITPGGGKPKRSQNQLLVTVTNEMLSLTRGCFYKTNSEQRTQGDLDERKSMVTWGGA